MLRHVRARLALIGLAGALAPAVAMAQGASRCEESADSPHGRNEQICAEERSRRTFNLFGLGDNAVAGLKASAPDATFSVSNSDIGDQATLGTGNMMYLQSLPLIGNRNSSRFFEIHFYATAAPGDFFKARDTTGIESLQNVRGGGYTFMSNTSAGGEGDFHTGHDGSIGVLFAGEKAASGSCLDQSRSRQANGKTLLAISDCEATWPELSGQRVWRGSPYFGQDAWLSYGNQVGMTNLSFDWWKVPTSLADPERRFIGTSAQTYGITSDHGRETRGHFGNTIPGGRGDPKFDGYLLGLDYIWDAMTFNVTSVGRLMVVQVKVVNNSAEVYGTGIDYDSLFIGLSTRWLNGDEQGLGRRANVHAIPELGAVVANELGRTSNCDGAIVPSYILSAGCSGQFTRGTGGFKVGATGLLWFKTPIGDLRNKLFTRESSPFYAPGHPNAGDTITFNRMSLCGFDCANVQFNQKNMQRSFGTIAAREVQSVFGRPAPQAWTDYDWWHLFKPYTGLGTRVNLANPRGGGGYNYCVVPGWSYSNKPEKAPPSTADTLFLDTCNPTTNTTTGLWKDTLPDRSINWAFNNTWSGAGPFPLKAGDTTGFVFGIFAAPDSAQFMALMKNAYDFYLEFYLGPGIPSAPSIRSADVVGGSDVTNLWQARLTIDYTPSFRADPSIPSTVTKLRQAAAGTPEATLLELNPWLPDSILARAAGLVDTLYVFKSCNGGRTFTATKSRGICRTDRALDQSGLPVGTGWQAYAALVRDAAGNFPARYTDPFVQGGQKYLYSLVVHRPALKFTVLDTGQVPVAGGGTTAGIIQRTYTVLEAASSPLKVTPGDPSVVEVYVPASPQGGRTNVAVASSVIGPTPLTFHSVSVASIGSFTEPLRYTVFFGDSVVVEQRDGITRGFPDSTRIWLYRSVRTGFDGTTATRMIRDTLVFATNELTPFSPGTGATTTSSETVVVGASDTVVVTTRRYTGLVAVVAESSTRRPFFVSANFGTNFQPPVAAGLPNAPPLVFGATQRTGTLWDRYWSQPGIGVVRSVSTPDLAFATDAANVSATGTSYGHYQFTFRDSEFGPGQPFTLDFTNPEATRAQVTQSLQARVRADSTRIDAETVRIINETLGRSLTADSLVKLYVPFAVRNLVVDSTGAGNGVTLAALRSSVTSADGTPRRFKLGSGADTISIPMPADAWVPGTPLLFIENVMVVDTVGGRPRLDASGAPIYRREPRVTFSRATLGCVLDGDITRCNAVRGRGESDYIQVRAQQAYNVRYNNPFTAETEVAFTLQPPQLASDERPVTKGDLDRVKVVPNPYVVTSAYEQGGDIRRLLFTNVPPQGIIRIYTAAGTLVQQLTWTPEMLNGNGDLFWDMRTREGFDAAPGLYLFTIDATGPGGGAKRRTPGRFIIIR